MKIFFRASSIFLINVMYFTAKLQEHVAAASETRNLSEILLSSWSAPSAKKIPAISPMRSTANSTMTEIMANAIQSTARSTIDSFNHSALWDAVCKPLTSPSTSDANQVRWALRFDQVRQLICGKRASVSITSAALPSTVASTSNATIASIVASVASIPTRAPTSPKIANLKNKKEKIDGYNNSTEILTNWKNLREKKMNATQPVAAFEVEGRRRIKKLANTIESNSAIRARLNLIRDLCHFSGANSCNNLLTHLMVPVDTTTSSSLVQETSSISVPDSSNSQQLEQLTIQETSPSTQENVLTSTQSSDSLQNFIRQLISTRSQSPPPIMNLPSLASFNRTPFNETSFNRTESGWLLSEQEKLQESYALTLLYQNSSVSQQQQQQNEQQYPNLVLNHIEQQQLLQILLSQTPTPPSEEQQSTNPVPQELQSQQPRSSEIFQNSNLTQQQPPLLNYSTTEEQSTPDRLLTEQEQHKLLQFLFSQASILQPGRDRSTSQAPGEQEPHQILQFSTPLVREPLNSPQTQKSILFQAPLNLPPLTSTSSEPTSTTEPLKPLLSQIIELLQRESALLQQQHQLERSLVPARSRQEALESVQSESRRQLLASSEKFIDANQIQQQLLSLNQSQLLQAPELRNLPITLPSPSQVYPIQQQLYKQQPSGPSLQQQQTLSSALSPDQFHVPIETTLPTDLPLAYQPNQQLLPSQTLQQGPSEPPALSSPSPLKARGQQIYLSILARKFSNGHFGNRAPNQSNDNSQASVPQSIRALLNSYNTETTTTFSGRKDYTLHSDGKMFVENGIHAYSLSGPLEIPSCGANMLSECPTIDSLTVSATTYFGDRVKDGTIKVEMDVPSRDSESADDAGWHLVCQCSPSVSEKCNFALASQFGEANEQLSFGVAFSSQIEASTPTVKCSDSGESYDVAPLAEEIQFGPGGSFDQVLCYNS